jgi:hypothetical protein
MWAEASPAKAAMVVRNFMMRESKDVVVDVTGLWSALCTLRSGVGLKKKRNAN